MAELTILTPTYNRGSLLENCYRSLAQQTCMDFEWVIVDDGSEDDTKKIISAIREKEHHFKITYIWKENGGKHTALNASHPFIYGKYVLILDSDDTLTENAVAFTLENWSHWENHHEVGIVTLLKGRDRYHPNCYGAVENVPVDIIAGKRIRPVSSDACEVIRTELFLQYPFPVFQGETFMAETALWGRVSMSHKCVYVNRVIYLCDYHEDGLTKAGRTLRIRNPLGGMYNANLYMGKKNPVKVRLKNGLLFTCYGFFAKLRLREIADKCDHKALLFLCVPFGWILFLYWRSQYLRQ